MTDTTEKDKKNATLTIRPTQTLQLTKSINPVRQDFVQPRSTGVTSVRRPKAGAKTMTVTVVEVRDKKSRTAPRKETTEVETPTIASMSEASAAKESTHFGGLTEGERSARIRALKQAEEQAAAVAIERVQEEETRRKNAIEKAKQKEQEVELEAVRKQEEAVKAAALEVTKREAEKQTQPAESHQEKAEKMPESEAVPAKPSVGTPLPASKVRSGKTNEEEEEDLKRSGSKSPKAAPGAAVVGEKKIHKPEKSRWEEGRRQSGKITITNLVDGEEQPQRVRSLASIRRAREKARQAETHTENEKQIRDVVIPETISVQDLSARMAERGADVVKELMKMGMMVTITQTIDADTAELVVLAFGHKVKRVTEADVENVLQEDEDDLSTLVKRAPVVTVMGHVDHGKTSLLDALRSTDVAAGEAGGITQHIGAYRVRLEGGENITFLDTPGHEAFTAMRSRGAKATDIVVLVVAADDGIMAQTIEAINHAKAAEVPIIVAINKIDKPGANPGRVREELLSHGLIPEELGGDTMVIEVSAKERRNLDKLEEAILLQAEVLDVKANPDRSASGVVVEAKMDHTRGVVASLLIQKGTLSVGDIVVAGQAYGKVRVLMDDKGQAITKALPSVPVEILGLSEVPEAGDPFAVVETEKQARDITEFRSRRSRTIRTTAVRRGSLEEMLTRAGMDGKLKELPIIVKTDVQGSMEAIIGSLQKISTDEVKVKILHAAVGGITESDVVLANASHAIIIGFNVRAGAQARAHAARDGVDIRYYSIIYNLIDDIKGALSGMLSPVMREEYLGNAEIRQVFSVTKSGKVAGCMVLEGIVKRGAKVRLLRDNVVIHEGKLKTLRRFKDDAKEVREGFECGMAFENYDDIREKDIIEAFEIIEEKQYLS